MTAPNPKETDEMLILALRRIEKRPVSPQAWLAKATAELQQHDPRAYDSIDNALMNAEPALRFGILCADMLYRHPPNDSANEKIGALLPRIVSEEYGDDSTLAYASYIAQEACGMEEIAFLELILHENDRRKFKRR